MPEAAKLANAWADLVVDKVNVDFFNYDQALVDQFGSQLAAAKVKMDRAEAALVDFIENDPRDLLTDRISSLKSEQSRAFWKQRQLKEARFDALGIYAQLEEQADVVRVDDSFRISYLLIQSKLYSSGSDIMLESPRDSVSVSSLELQNQYDLDFMTVSEFRGMLENWIATIDEQIAQLEMEEETYLEEINTLEVELRNLNYQKSLLDADYNTYRNTYETLQKKNEEIALTMSDLSSGYVKLASQAAVPDERLPHNTVRNTLIGGVAGGFLGLAGVVVSDWWSIGEGSKEN